MSLLDAVTLLTRFTYLLIAGLTFVDFLLHRDRTRLDIALAFLVLAVNILIQAITSLTHVTAPPALTYFGSVMTIAQPHMLLRLVAHFRPVARRVLVLSTVGLGLCVVLLALPVVVPDSKLPLPALILIVAYFVWAEGYASVSFVRGALTTGGVSRWRYALAALGSILLVVIILEAGLLAAAGVATRLPALLPYLQSLTQFLALVSGLAFFLAFAPPRWVRQFWQYSELHRFLRTASGQPVRERAGHILPFLCETAQRALGGSAGVAALDNGTGTQLVVRAASGPSLMGQVLDLPTGTSGPLPAAWHERRAVVANRRQELSPAGTQLVDVVGGDALCAVPIATPERSWGLLIVLLQRRPLFPDDDLELLRLFSEQAAFTLDQNALLNEQEALIGSLRDRTAQLEAANHELEAFSYSVSHDLRAPLRHIEGFTDLLLRADTAEPIKRQHLQRIAEAAVRMGRLIDSLLSFSRMGRAELRRVPVQLDHLLAEARQELAAETQGRSIEWVVQPLPEVLADPDLLRQVLVNLLSNALKYSRDRKPPKIEVGTEPAAGAEVVIYVRDNGVGFDMQYSDKLFNVFQRLHHADEFEGIGIGLANVRRIIYRHGGRTWASSQVGQGATFYFSLPAPVLALPAAVALPLPAVAAPSAAISPGGLISRD